MRYDFRIEANSKRCPPPLAVSIGTTRISIQVVPPILAPVAISVHIDDEKEEECK